MIKEYYHTFMVIHDAGYINEDRFINIKADSLREAYTKVIDICYNQIGLENIKIIEYKGTDLFELYE